MDQIRSPLGPFGGWLISPAYKKVRDAVRCSTPGDQSARACDSAVTAQSIGFDPEFLRKYSKDNYDGIVTIT